MRHARSSSAKPAPQPRSDDTVERVVEERAAVLAGAQSVRGTSLGCRALAQMGELVRFEVRERCGKVELDGFALGGRKLVADLLEEAPSEARVSDLVGPDAREELSQRALRH